MAVFMAEKAFIRYITAHKSRNTSMLLDNTRLRLPRHLTEVEEQMESKQIQTIQMGGKTTGAEPDAVFSSYEAAA